MSSSPVSVADLPALLTRLAGGPDDHPAAPNSNDARLALSRDDGDEPALVPGAAAEQHGV